MPFLTSLRDSSGPTVAVEVAAHQVSAASLEFRGGKPFVAAHAVEPLPDGALVPSLTVRNAHNRVAVVAALTRVLERTGRPRRVGLVVPDLVAKVSLVRFEQVPARTADLDQLVRWQVRKAAPFAIEEAQVSYVPGQRAADGQEFIVSLARRDVVEEYESLVRRRRRARWRRGSRHLQRRQRRAGWVGAVVGRLAPRQRRARLRVDCDHAGRAPHLLQEPRGRNRGHAGRSGSSNGDVLRRPSRGRRLWTRLAGRRRRHRVRIRPATSSTFAGVSRNGSRRPSRQWTRARPPD